MAEPVRFPSSWSGAWFQRFYAEVLARPLPVGAVVISASDPRPIYGYGEWTSLGSGEVAGVTVSLYERTA